MNQKIKSSRNILLLLILSTNYDVTFVRNIYMTKTVL